MINCIRKKLFERNLMSLSPKTLGFTFATAKDSAIFK